MQSNHASKTADQCLGCKNIPEQPPTTHTFNRRNPVLLQRSQQSDWFLWKLILQPLSSLLIKCQHVSVCILPHVASGYEFTGPFSVLLSWLMFTQPARTHKPLPHPPDPGQTLLYVSRSQTDTHTPTLLSGCLDVHLLVSQHMSHAELQKYKYLHLDKVLRKKKIRNWLALGCVM